MKKFELSLPTHIDSEILFFLAYGIFLSMWTLRLTFFSLYIPFGIVKLLIAFFIGIFMMCEVFRDRIKSKELIFMGVCFLFTAVLWRRGSLSLCPLFLFVFCGRRISFEKIASFTAKVTVICLIIIFISAEAGIIRNYVDYDRETGRARHYLGFLYALYPQLLLYNAASLDLYVKRRDLKPLTCLFWMVIALYVFVNTDARLSFISTVLVILCFYFLKLFPDFVKKMKKLLYLAVYSYVFCGGFSLIFISKYDSSKRWMRLLNKSLEGRLSLGKRAFKKYDIKLFGQKINFIGNGLSSDGVKSSGVYDYVDNFYENILLRFGVLFLLLILFICVYSSYFAWKRNDFHLLALFTLSAVHGLIDDLIIYLNYNALWFVIGWCLFAVSANKYNYFKDVILNYKPKKRVLER